MSQPIESHYPISFRSKEAEALATHLKHLHSVTLVGMKRVGISNFLRYFLYNPQVSKTYLSDNHRLFVPVDLNDLIEVDLYAFWKLTLKRLVDTIESQQLPESLKKYSRRAFLEALQLKDLMVTIDNLKSVLLEVQKHDYFPTLFLIRFDRLKNVLTEAFFGNLQSIVDATNQKTTYVFTSFRPLHQLSPEIFPKSALSVFTKDLYLQPTNQKDSQTVLETFKDRYNLKLDQDTEKELINLSAGHVQYLQLSLLKLKSDTPLPSGMPVEASAESGTSGTHHLASSRTSGTPEDTGSQFIDFLTSDEEIQLQSEELCDSLTDSEQNIITKQYFDTKDDNKYLWDTGLLTPDNQIFSPLLANFISHRSQQKPKLPEFTKKEHLLFSVLKDNLNELVERDQIIEAVWPDQMEFGISDWAIDRLVGRVRAKLKNQQAAFKIQTVITRGYKLVNIS